MNNPLVSIAMATYNGEKFLQKQLDSIYGQTYKNIEVIVTDDCSTDKTVEILQEYKKNYGLKYHINDHNLGFIKNFEKAITLSNGNYVALADQDDIWLPEKIETLVEKIKGYSLVCSDASLINGNDEIMITSFNEYSGRSIPKDKVFQYLVFGNYVTGCTAMIDKELFSNALPVPKTFSFHDWWFAIAASQDKGINYIPEKLVLYRQHSENVSGAGKKISLFSFFTASVRKQKKIVQQYKLKHEQIKFLLDNNVYKNTEEKKFLEDALDFTNLYLGQKSSIKSVFFTIKNSKNIPQRNTIGVQILKVSYLFYRFLLIRSKCYINKGRNNHD